MKQRLGDHLVSAGCLTPAQLAEALELQKQSGGYLGQILMDKGWITEKHLVLALSAMFHIPYFSLEDFTATPELCAIFKPEKLKAWKVFPVRFENGLLTVAGSNPLDVNMLHDLKYFSGHRIGLVLSTSQEILDCIGRHFGSTQNLQEAMQDVHQDQEAGDGAARITLKDLERSVQDAPVVKLVNSIIDEAVKQKASDIHLEPRRQDMRVRYRIDGVLRESFVVPKELQMPVASRIKIISGMDIAEARRPQDGRMSVTSGMRTYDMRVSTLPDAFGEKVVLRILDKGNMRLSLDTLGFLPEEKAFVEALVQTPYGIILLTGPTGSGKTTSLYSMLNRINDETRNIVTVEDPIEYELDGINQTAVNVRAGYTFATGIRHILRQDPDVIMIGEIRDLETAEIAIQAALTGHLVFSTLHTNTAPGAVTRLLDMNVEPFLISSAVIGVINQRLLRVLCPHCKRRVDDASGLHAEMLADAPHLKAGVFYGPGGCDQCNNIGYQGRCAVMEMMPITQEIRSLVLKSGTELEIEQAALRRGMKTLVMAGLEKAAAGMTSLDEVARVTFMKKG